MSLVDEDGIDGPFNRRMKEAEDEDARAFRKGAGAIEALLDVDLEVVTQHAPKRGSALAMCGAVGQVKEMGVGVTCEACKRMQARNAARRSVRRKAR